MSAISIGIAGGSLCFELSVGGETLRGCVKLEDIRTAVFGDNGGVPFVLPELPELPDSLKKRMTQEEIKAYTKAKGTYKQNLTVAIRGQPV